MLRAITDLIHAGLLGLPAANLFILGAGGASQMALVVKNSPANATEIREAGSIPGSGRSPGGGHGKPPVLEPGEYLWTEEPGELWSIKSQSWTQL